MLCLGCACGSIRLCTLVVWNFDIIDRIFVHKVSLGFLLIFLTVLLAFFFFFPCVCVVDLSGSRIYCLIGDCQSLQRILLDLKIEILGFMI